MRNRDVIVIGSSAGGVSALKDIVGSLPANFAATIFIVQHIAPDSISLLPGILSFKGNISAAHAVDGEKFEKGKIYIAPPDRHLLIEGDHMLVTKGPQEKRFRPSINALFRSAAYSHGNRVIGVVLTGMLDDGTSGMWSVKRLGGISIVQKPEDAAYSSMPESVLEHVNVDHVLQLSEIGPLLNTLVLESVVEC